jgi:hypothetical protein
VQPISPLFLFFHPATAIGCRPVSLPPTSFPPGPAPLFFFSFSLFGPYRHPTGPSFSGPAYSAARLSLSHSLTHRQTGPPVRPVPYLPPAISLFRDCRTAPPPPRPPLLFPFPYRACHQCALTPRRRPILSSPTAAAHRALMSVTTDFAPTTLVAPLPLPPPPYIRHPRARLHLHPSLTCSLAHSTVPRRSPECRRKTAGFDLLPLRLSVIKVSSWSFV